MHNRRGGYGVSRKLHLYLVDRGGRDDHFINTITYEIVTKKSQNTGPTKTLLVFCTSPTAFSIVSIPLPCSGLELTNDHTTL